MLCSVPPEAMSIPPMRDGFGGQTFTEAGHIQNIKGALLQDAGALTVLAVFSRLVLDDQVIYPVDVQQVG